MIAGRGPALRTAVAIGLALLGPGCAGEAPRHLPSDRSAPLLYVALGDSTVAGVGASDASLNYVSRLHARLREQYPAARVENLGVGGATSADVLRAQLPPAVARRPQLVTLSVGPNDLTGRVPAGDFERTMRRILTALVEGTPALVVVNLLPDLAVTRRFQDSPQRERVARLTVEFNDALRRAARDLGVVLVDLHGPSRAEVPRRPELLSADGYHPSDAGYARWAELVWAELAPRILTRS